MPENTRPKLKNRFWSEACRHHLGGIDNGGAFKVAVADSFRSLVVGGARVQVGDPVVNKSRLLAGAVNAENGRKEPVQVEALQSFVDE